jgi:D-serine deaminase-like pyridoxal phosphate-dependent protein
VTRDLGAEVERHRLASRLDRALSGLPERPGTPIVVVDLDAFDANARDLARRAAGTPIRVATKSLRVPTLVSRALAAPGFHGVLAYSLREALWLHEQGLCDDIVMGYPTVDPAALRRLAADPAAAKAVTLMVDDPAHLDVVDAARTSPGTEVRVAIDVDAGLRVGTAHVGPKRSPLHDPAQVVALAREVVDRPGFALVGVMTYEGQVAGVPDSVPTQRARSLAVRRLKSASVHQLEGRRAEVAAALVDLVDLEFWNAGGSGSIESSSADPTVTEVTAGSGLLVPALFDHYRSFEPRPAAFFGLPVVRRPSDSCVTVAGGGLVASGAAGKDRLPLPWAPPGLHLTALEGAGEVQTPLVGPAASSLGIGDLVWFRHAKSGELAEHVREVHLLSGDTVVDVVPTYRGTGNAW